MCALHTLYSINNAKLFIEIIQYEENPFVKLSLQKYQSPYIMRYFANSTTTVERNIVAIKRFKI